MVICELIADLQNNKKIKIRSKKVKTIPEF